MVIQIFCWDPIPVSWIKGLQGTVLEGKKLASHDYVYPMPASLCMGFSWSLYFAQLANETLMSKIPSLVGSQLVSDEGPPMVFGPESSEQVRHYVYVDNLGIISPHEALVKSSLAELLPGFDDRGLVLHPGEIQHEHIQALGCSMRGDIMATRVSPSRFVRLRQAIGGVLQRKKVSGRLIEILLGHVTFCCLCNRQLLSIFSAIYKFIRRNYFVPVKLWESVRRELWAFRSLMIYLHSDWWRQWNPLVSSSDSSLEGYGVSTSFWKTSDVAACGRRLERSRFKKAASTAARDHALTSAGFVKDELTESWRRREITSEELLEASGWEVSDDFVEVPGRLLAKPLWEPKLWGRWGYEAGILELEGRALVKSLRRIALSPYGTGIRQLLLVDNMSVALSFDRFRSRNYRLLKQIRRFSSYLLSRNIATTVRWVPSELNSSDEPSRYFAQEESKLLTHLIPLVPDSGHGTEENAEFGPTSFGAKEVFCGSEGFVEAPNQEGQSAQQKGGVGEDHPGDRSADYSESVSSPLQPFGCRPLAAGWDKDKESSEVPFPKFHQQHFGSRWKRKDFEEEESKAVPQVGRWSHGQQQPFAFGEKCSGPSESQVLSSRDGGLQDVCTPPRLGFGGLRECGQATSGLHEWPLPEGVSGLPCRPSGGSYAALQPPVWQDGFREVTQDVEGFERIQKAHPGEESSGLPLDGVGSSGLGTSSDGKAQDGTLPARVPLELCSSFGAHQASGVLPCSAIPRDHFFMDTFDEPRRKARQDQDWGVRHQHCFGHPLHDPLEPHFVRISQAGSSFEPTLGLRLQSVLPRFSDCCDGSRSGPDTVPDPTLRTFNRSFKRISKPVGGSKARPVEKSDQRDALREGSKIGSHSREPPLGSAGTLPIVRGKAWGDHVGVMPKSRLRKKQVSRKYIMDLFAGHGGVSEACEKLGYFTKQWDIKHGPMHDLTDRSVVKRLIRDIRKGRVLGVMMAPVCTSFSRARDRTKVIRSLRFPWGIPKRFLSEKEALSIKLGNACFRSCIQLIHVLNLYSIPWILENPWMSRCWQLPPIRQLLQKNSAFLCRGDFCQWGTNPELPISQFFFQEDH